MVQAVNQHAHVMKLVTSEMKTKVNVFEITEAFTIIGSAIPSQLVDRPPPTDLTSLKDTATRTALGVSALGKHVVKLREFEEATQQNLSDIRRTLDGKASIEYVKKKVKKAKHKFQSMLDAKVKEINATIATLQTTLWEKVSAQDKKISDLEVNTLWKLKDVEELLKSRVNDKFVWDAINATIGKGKKDLKDLGTELNTKIDKWARDLQERLGRVEDTDRTSTEQLRSLLEQLEAE